MSKLCLALLDDANKVENFVELNMSWVESFNNYFQKSEVPDKEKVYKLEFIDMASVHVLNSFVKTTDDQEFVVDSTPLKNLLTKLFKY